MRVETSWESPIGTDYDAGIFAPVASVSQRLEVLRRFCGKDQYRYYIEEPWTVGQWSYATDNRICIRVDAVGPDSPPPREKRLPDVSCLPWTEIASEREWIALPELPKLRFKFNGTEWEPVQTPVRFDGSRQLVDAHLLSRIKDLPGVMVNAKSQRWHLLFTFNFGVGMTTKYVERRDV